VEQTPKKVYKSFYFQTAIEWVQGRRGVVSAAARPGIEVSSPVELKGEPGLWTPEELLLAAINSCLLMTFLAYALREEINLSAFSSAAEGRLEHSEGKYRITEVVLKPEVVVRDEEDVLLAGHILERAHQDCIISNSVRAAVKVVPDIHASSPPLNGPGL
jgi:peroxiredoxin-like protein